MRHVKTIHAIPIRINKDIEEILLVPQHKWKINGRPMFAPMTKKLLLGNDSQERTLQKQIDDLQKKAAALILRRLLQPPPTATAP